MAINKHLTPFVVREKQFRIAGKGSLSKRPLLGIILRLGSRSLPHLACSNKIKIMINSGLID